MKIASYNIWDSHAGMPHRMTQIIRELQNTCADILCLQEVADLSTHNILASALKYSHTYMNEPAGTSILSRYPITPAFSLAYSTSVYVCTDTSIFLTNLHLPWESASEREKAIVEIIRECDKCCADYTILVGDFNCSENASVHRFLLGEQSLAGCDAYYFDLAEAWADMTGIPAEPTLNFRKNPRWNGKNTMEKNQRFDRILLKNPYPNEYPALRKISLFGTSVDPETKLSASDHYGVMGELIF